MLPSLYSAVLSDDVYARQKRVTPAQCHSLFLMIPPNHVTTCTRQPHIVAVAVTIALGKHRCGVVVGGHRTGGGRWAGPRAAERDTNMNIVVGRLRWRR